jgi:MFS family permease
MATNTESRFSLRAVPRTVWALGFVSLLMDTSSEIIHALLPVYLVSVLGASMVTVGFVEGIAEATASITKVFSGAISDWSGKRKLLAVTGYGLAAISKPIFPLAPSVGWLVAARFVDRIGKGIRGAPRDALIADVTPERLRGASYGLRQSLDTAGAFIGPALAIGLMWLTADNFRSVFWVAVIPALLCVVLLVVAVDEPERPPALREVRSPLGAAELRRLGVFYWFVVSIAMVFSLARFSEAFLILRAQAVGLPVALVPLVLVLMNLVYSAVAYPAGLLSDRTSRVAVLGAGFGFLVVADLVLAFTNGLVGVAAGVALWGLHLGFTQGLLAALVADAAPAQLRGTAFGMFNLLVGLSLLIASVVAGALWERIGPQGTFLAGAAFTLLALAGLALARRIAPA